MMNGMGGGGMWFGSLFWLVMLGLVVWAVISYSRRNTNQAGGTTGQQKALDILKKRYASGEITKEEFEQMKRDLQ